MASQVMITAAIAKQLIAKTSGASVFIAVGTRLGLPAASGRIADGMSSRTSAPHQTQNFHSGRSSRSQEAHVDIVEC